jgi:hypothetical protein
MAATTLPQREIVFAEGFAPQLPGGEYDIEATQTLAIASETAPIEFHATKTVYVAAPRFALDPDVVYSVHPPAGQTGAFHTHLPHIVLTRKTLPWERVVIDTETGATIRPQWMALLTIDDDEIADEKIEIASVPVTEALTPPAGLLGPQLRSEPGDEAAKKQGPVLVARMPLDYFHKIAPALDELRFLAHARRQPGGDDKDPADISGDGWFAVVVGNRRPKQRIRNHGLLISLEGFDKILKANRADTIAARPGQRLQAIALYHWTYVAEGLTFGELLDGLTKKDGIEKDVWLRVSPEANGQPADAGTVANALRQGYTALEHRMRQGGRSVSWYRGPLIPMPVDTPSYHAIHTNADEALQYDPGSGLFNASYAAAWQLGRLLALQNTQFTDFVARRRDGYVASGVLDEARQRLGIPAKREDELKEKAKLLLQDNFLVALLTEFWLSDPANGAGNSGGAA